MNVFGQPKLVAISMTLRADTRIYQISIQCEGGSVEVRTPIDFLRGTREALEGNDWADDYGNSILNAGGRFEVKMSERHGHCEIEMHFTKSQLLDLSLAAEEALRNMEVQVDVRIGFAESWPAMMLA